MQQISELQNCKLLVQKDSLNGQRERCLLSLTMCQYLNNIERGNKLDKVYKLLPFFNKLID